MKPTLLHSPSSLPLDKFYIFSFIITQFSLFSYASGAELGVCHEMREGVTARVVALLRLAVALFHCS